MLSARTLSSPSPELEVDRSDRQSFGFELFYAAFGCRTSKESNETFKTSAKLARLNAKSTFNVVYGANFTRILCVFLRRNNDFLQ